jgi:hypothetical protein
MIDPLRSLTYVSTPCQPFNSEELHALSTESSRHNALNGITGMLVFNGRRFCQTIEGGVDAVDHLLARLRCDPRHKSLIVASDDIIDVRRFGSWRMRALYLMSENASDIEPHVREHLETVDPHRWFWAA